MEKNHSLFLSVFLCLKSLSYLIYFIFIAIAIAFFAAVFIARQAQTTHKVTHRPFFFSSVEKITITFSIRILPCCSKCNFLIWCECFAVVVCVCNSVLLSSCHLILMFYMKRITVTVNRKYKIRRILNCVFLWSALCACLSLICSLRQCSSVCSLRRCSSICSLRAHEDYTRFPFVEVFPKI